MDGLLEVQTPQKPGFSEAFIAEGGKLRLSVTKRCGLSCTFCHREGGLDRGKMVLDAQFFAQACNDYYALGGKDVSITGGEPAMFRGLTEMLDAIRRPHDAKLSISTNGCDIAPLLAVRDKGVVTKINVSLHGHEDGFLKTIISPRFDYDLVCRNIEALSEHYYTCVNFSLMRENETQFGEVADFTLSRGLDIKVINFQEIKWNQGKMVDQFVALEVLARELETIARTSGLGFEKLENGGVYGALIETYRVGRSKVTMINGEIWHKSMGACTNCQFSSICKEGFYALRLYSDATFAPCLYREDLATKYDRSASLQDNIDALLERTQ